jgi:hypothetical protein
MSVNQRRETRHPLNLDAFFMTAQLGPQICKVRDFCTGGMYLSYTNRLIRFKRGEEMTVNFNLTVDDIAQACQVQVYVAHSVEGGMGVAFAKTPSEELLESLDNESARAAKVTPEQTAKPEAVRLMQACRLICSQHIASLTKEFLTQVRQQLLLAAGQTLNAEEKKEYNDAASFIQKNPNRISENFSRKMNKTIENWIESIPQIGEVEGTLPIFSDAEEDFEDWLAIKVMVTKIETEFLEDLYAIQLRLNHLLKSKLGSHNNPFGPYVICHTFKDVFDPFMFKQKSEKVIYRSFSDMMLKHMRALYITLNDFLIQENVLPKLTFGGPLRGLSSNQPDTNI